eukprot:NODE_625_length_1317_cov_103.040336_g586_i0.p1 GENE.NODE_625_length_1317_cov_103.040336_g586_i0~~NODE_625_length_1317_cov_103.040336_g586_i0.p1  ORF type:complete len:403 (+),score=78.75 NODE_625_length_1317_cov_103.040336_g586_i0:70-1278(+)
MAPTVTAIILTGGPSRGTRFRPLSFNVPKPLFPIGGKPLVLHHIMACAEIPNIKEIILLGFFDPSMFESFVTATSAKLNIPVKYLKEYQAMGTGGGIYHYRDRFRKTKTDAIIVLHGDVLCEFNLPDLLSYHASKSAEATLLGKKIPVDLTRFFGVIVHDEGNKVEHYVEKPETIVTDVVNCGVYVFNATMLLETLENSFRDRLSDQSGDEGSEDEGAGDRLSLELDVIAKLAGTGRMFVSMMNRPWAIVKTPSAALVANKLVLATSSPKQALNGNENLKTVYVDPTATVHPTASLGPNVSVGANASIGPGVRVRNSIVLDDAVIQANACVLNSIVGWRSKIGKWARIEGGNASNKYGVVGDAKEITVLGEDVSVANEIIIRHCVVLPHKELKTSAKNDIIM